MYYIYDSETGEYLMFLGEKIVWVVSHLADKFTKARAELLLANLEADHYAWSQDEFTLTLKRVPDYLLMGTQNV